MSRKNRSPEEKARRAKIRELLQMANIDSMDDIQDLFKETIAEFMENGLEAELDEDLGYSKYDYKNKTTDNSRNGHSSKNLRTSFGDVEVSVPRDRKGEFEPQLLKKNQTSISQDIEEKILSMYAKGMTTGDIEAHIQDIYGLAVSDTTVSRITDKILPVAKEWQQRPLELIYPRQNCPGCKTGTGRCPEKQDRGRPQKGLLDGISHLTGRKFWLARKSWYTHSCQSASQIQKMTIKGEIRWKIGIRVIRCRSVKPPLLCA